MTFEEYKNLYPVNLMIAAHCQPDNVKFREDFFEIDTDMLAELFEKEIFPTLKHQEVALIKLRYQQHLTCAKAAKLLPNAKGVVPVNGMSNTRVTQIEQRVLRKLRHPSRNTSFNPYLCASVYPWPTNFLLAIGCKNPSIVDEDSAVVGFATLMSMFNKSRTSIYKIDLEENEMVICNAFINDDRFSVDEIVRILNKIQNDGNMLKLYESLISMLEMKKPEIIMHALCDIGVIQNRNSNIDELEMKVANAELRAFKAENPEPVRDEYGNINIKIDDRCIAIPMSHLFGKVSNRTYNTICKTGCRTIGDTIRLLTDNERITHVRGFGRNTLEEIIEVLVQEGCLTRAAGDTLKRHGEILINQKTKNK